MVDGISLPLTQSEQSEHDARATAWAAGAADRDAKASLPDLATQVAHLASALVSKGVLQSTDLPQPVLEVVNNKLLSMGAIQIPTISQEEKS